MKGKTLLALTLAAGLAVPLVGFAQSRTETGTGGGVNDNQTSTRAASATDADTGTSTKTKKKTATVRESHKNRAQKSGTEPVNATNQADTTQNATGAGGSFPTTREPGYRKSMSSLGKRDSLLDAQKDTTENSGNGR